ncbi:hypothetical protein HDU86_000523 [Geranomyces michiganensis]|nr:hypothetical protein HDU86_000523 [Geranomyces michiganensis]
MTVGSKRRHRNKSNNPPGPLLRPPPLRLPDEVLGIIFLHLQPHYVRQEGNTPWTDGTCRTSRELWKPLTNNGNDRDDNNNDGSAVIVHDWIRHKKGAKRYHPTITINRIASRRHCRPLLLDVGSVNRQWRRVSLQHPFWTDLGWHHLLDLRGPRFTAISATAGGPTAALDNFFNVMSNCPTRLSRVRSITLDLVCWRREIGIDTLLTVLRRVSCSQLVHTFVLEAGWDVGGDSRLVRLLATQFPNLRRVHIGGQPTPQIYYGLGSAALKHWAKHWRPGTLTHLSLQGYGKTRTFSNAALLSLLATQPNITHLVVGYVRNELDSVRVKALLPSLKSLGYTRFIELPPGM